MSKRPRLERASWVAGIAAALLALFGLFQAYGPSSGNNSSVTGNQAPVVVTQSSPNTMVVVNIPPARQRTDQDNCSAGERWVGMNPHRAEWSGEIPIARVKTAVFYGELRWAPEINGKRNTTEGIVRLEVDGKSTILYEWNSPPKSTHEFQVPLGQHLQNTSGKYRITWIFRGGSSGICVARSEVSA